MPGLRRVAPAIDVFDCGVDLELKHDPVLSDLGDVLGEVGVELAGVEVLARNETNLGEFARARVHRQPREDWSS